MSAAASWRTAPTQRRGRCKLIAVLAVVLTALLVGAAWLGSGVARADSQQVAHAKDGSATYTSVDEAWAAARSGKVIVMDADWYREVALGVPSNETVILEMNGHKVYRNGGRASDGAVFWLYENSSLTLDGTGASADIQYSAYTGTTSTEIKTVTTGGLVTGGHSKNSGGGIEMKEGSTLTLVNVTVAGNKTYSDKGGGVAMNGSGCKLVMENSAIEYNCTESDGLGYGGDGGGVYVNSSECNITMTASSISYNVSEEGSGIYSDSKKTYIYMRSASRIDNNIDVGSSYRYGGGGIYFNSSDFNVYGDGTASISGNTSTNHGGGIATASSSGGKITGVTFDGNVGKSQGGAIYVNSTGVTIENCVFKNNKVNDGHGGALYLNGSGCNVNSCTFTGNSAVGSGANGGAIYNNSKNDYIRNCEITGNTAANEGGGVFSNYEDNIYLRGVVLIYGNTRGALADGNADDLFLDSNRGESIWAYVMGNVDEGSWIGVRTGNTGKREIVKELSNYIEGTYFLDMPGSFHLEYSADESILYQQDNKASHTVYANANAVESYDQGTAVTVDGRTLCDDSEAFWCWDADNTSGLSGIDALKYITAGDLSTPVLKFTMPGNDVKLGFKTVKRLSTVSFELDAPVPDEELPASATLTYTVDGAVRLAEVPVTWYKLVDGEYVEATGDAEFYTTYRAQIVSPQVGENGLAYALDMTSESAPLYIGGSKESAVAIVSVDSQTGTLTVTSADLKTRAKKIESIDELAGVTLKAGESADTLKGLMPQTVSATGEDGNEVVLAVSIPETAEADWQAAGLLDQDGAVAEPESDKASASHTVSLDVAAPEGTELPEGVSSVTIAVTVKHSDRTVTLDLGNGTQATTTTLEWGAMFPTPDTPVWQGHIFTGWYANGSTTQYDFSKAVTENLTIAAGWKCEVYDVEFDADGGLPATQLQRIEWGNPATLPFEPTKEHYDFAGWYTEDGQEWDFLTAITSDTKLVAHWSPVVYQVTFKPENGENDLVVDAVYDTLVEQPQEPETDGFEFLGWYTDDNQKWDFATSRVSGNVTLTAHWKALVYTVRFSGNGGKPAMQAEDVAWGDCVSEPTEPTLANKSFGGWYAEGSDEAWDFSTPVTSDMTLFARWNTVTYKVTFDPANGAGAATSEVESGTAVSQPAAPAREGYDFLGWYTADGTQWDFSTPVTSDVTLTAKWEIQVYTVRFSGNGGKPVMQTAEVVWGACAEEPVEPTLANKSFAGWYAEGSDEAWDFSTPVTSDVTLFARWNTVTYKVTFDPANGAGAATSEVESGTAVSQPAAPAREGYDFLGWYTADGTQWDFSTPVTSDVTLTAKWEIHVYTVRFSGNGGKPVMQTDEVVWGACAEEPVEPTKANMAFQGWYAAGSDEAWDFSTPVTSDMTLFARWNTVTYKVTFDPANGAGAATSEVESGTAVSQPAAPAREGYDFLGWYTADGTQWDFSTPVTSDLKLTAAWQVQVYAVRFYGNGGQPAIQVQDIEWGDCADVPFQPVKDHYDFVGWFANGSDEAWDFSTPVTSALTFTAQWAPSTYTVTFDPANGEDTFSYDVTYGDLLGNPGDPSQWGFEFQGWYTADGEKWDFDSLVEQDMTLTAVWVESDVVSFVDVPEGTWYHDWVYEAASYGLMTGYRDGVGAYTHLFGPQDYLRRGQVAVVLWRIAGYPAVEGDGNDFPDVDTDMYYSKAVSWCVSEGIITGYKSGSKAGCFCPENPVSREELAVMVYRFAQWAGVNTRKVPTDAFNACLDTASVSSWSNDAMVWCAAAGVLTGVDTDAGKLLDPQASTTRAQAAKIFVQTFSIVTGQVEPYTETQGDDAAAVQADETATFDDVVTFDAVEATEAAEPATTEQPAATEQPVATEQPADEQAEAAVEQPAEDVAAEEQAEAGFEDVEFDEAA